MLVLGLSAFVHDSGACLIRDGRVIANVEEERLDRVKHTNGFPARSIDYVLAEAGVSLGDVDVIAFNWNPFRAAIVEVIKLVMVPRIYFEIQQNYRPPKNFRSILASLLLRRALKNYKGTGTLGASPRGSSGASSRFKGRIVWVPHHLAHAAASYYLSPFNKENADIVVVDGHGEDCSTSVFSMVNGEFRPRWQAPIYDSLGLLYTTFTSFLGFEMYQEGKTMALASYGTDRYREEFRRIVELRPEGRYALLNKKYLGVWNFKEDGLGSEFGPRRTPGAPLEQRHYDIACSMQNCVKDAVLHVIRHARKESGHRNLALGGGVFLNCDINREIIKGESHASVFVPPFPSDSGGAIGAALYAAHTVCGEPVPDSPSFSPYLGPEYAAGDVLEVLERRRLRYREVAEPWLEAAELLHEHRVLGWFQGRMECGPRALGNRSILANPGTPGIRDYLNAKVKMREQFRPFAPVATREAALRFFELEEPIPALANYMLVTTKVRPEYRELLAGITHVDGTARIQVVSEAGNPPLYRLLEEFGRRSGYAVLLNTSFNLQEPIVCSPEDALSCFERTPLDALFVGNWRVERGRAEGG